MIKLISLVRSVASTSPVAALSWWVAWLFVELEAANLDVEILREERTVQWDKRKKAEARLFEVTKERDATLATCAELEASGAVMVSSLVAVGKELDQQKKSTNDANRACVELQGEVDKARAERDTSAIEAQGLRAKLDSLMVHAGPSCGACAEVLFVGGRSRAHTCGIAEDMTIESSSVENGAAELAALRKLAESSIFAVLDYSIRARLDSCHARRTNPNLLHGECSLGCGAPAGRACAPTSAEVTP